MNSTTYTMIFITIKLHVFLGLGPTPNIKLSFTINNLSSCSCEITCENFVNFIVIVSFLYHIS